MWANSASSGRQKTVDIGEKHGLAVALQLRPGELSTSSSSVPTPPGRRDERVGALEHQLLALMHAVDDERVPARRQERVHGRPETWG